tara:strand:+ start:191 stop:421 length:231 start_codon:yes stop_codon:yes gene_type:complete
LHKWEFFTSPSQFGNTLEGHNFSAQIAEPSALNTATLLKKHVRNRAGIITQSFVIHQAVISKNNDKFLFACTKKRH